jgi:hypothetical protein
VTPVCTHPDPAASAAATREIAHLRRRYERSRVTRDRYDACLDRLAAELLEQDQTATIVAPAGVA